MDIKNTKLYKENIEERAYLFKDIFKCTNLLQRINSLSFGEDNKQKNNKFCFVFSVCYVINHNLEDEINPRTIKKLFSIVKKELDNLIQRTIIKQKPIKKELNNDRFTTLKNFKELEKERVYLNLVIENDGTPENEFRILRQKYFELEQERYEIILFKVLFDNLEEISPSVDKNANRLLYDVFKKVATYRQSLKIDVFKLKEDIDSIVLYDNKTPDNLFKLNAVLIKDSVKGQDVINKYIENVEKQLTKLDNAKEDEAEILQKEIEESSKNIVKNRGNYYLVENNNFNTVINIDLEGIYYITNKEGKKVGRLPSSIIVNKSNALYLLDKFVSMALEDPYNPRLEIDFNNRDIAEFTNCLDEYERTQQDRKALSKKEYDNLYRKFLYEKEGFINKITNQLYYIRIDYGDLSTSVLNFKSLGSEFKDGIKIIFYKDYLDFRYKEGFIGNFNTYILDVFKTNLNAVRIYEGIVKDIYRNVLINTNYNYKFTLKQLRAFSGYVSDNYLLEHLDNPKARNKKIQETIRNDLKELRESGFILISQIKSKSEFTIMLNDRPMKELLELFNKQCEMNGHALIIDN